LRRFRMAWLETGKGQAKSPFMAGTGLYMTRAAHHCTRAIERPTYMRRLPSSAVQFDLT
jgi:hypothetical protein